MDPSNVINLSLMIVTAVGVFVAAWQALDARHARNEARLARDSASSHEQSAADASSRAAAALERSVQIADFALEETQRRNRFEREQSLRVDRSSLSSAIDLYLETWQPAWHLGQRITADGSRRALKRSAASISSEAEQVAEWVADELERTVVKVIDDHKSWDSNAGEAMLQMALLAARSEIGRRLTAWVASGLLDRSPLLP